MATPNLCIIQVLDVKILWWTLLAVARRQEQAEYGLSLTPLKVVERRLRVLGALGTDSKLIFGNGLFRT